MRLVTLIKNLLKIAKKKIVRDSVPIFSLIEILEKNYPLNSPFSIILIGAHDGISHDNLYQFLKQHNCKGIAVEPISSLFQQLTINYAFAPGITLINKAVHPVLKVLPMYLPDPQKLKDLPDWANGIASVYSNHHQKSGIEDSFIIQEKVQADSLMNMIQKHYPEKKVDLLQIDTEGFDLEILKQVNFSLLKPLIIRYEHAGLSVSDIKFSIKFLRSKGYYLYHDHIDIFGIRLTEVRL